MLKYQEVVGSEPDGAPPLWLQEVGLKHLPLFSVTLFAVPFSLSISISIYSIYSIYLTRTQLTHLPF